MSFLLFFKFSLDHWLASYKYIPNVKFRFGPGVRFCHFPHCLRFHMFFLFWVLTWSGMLFVVLVNNQCWAHFRLLVCLLWMIYLLLFLELTLFYSLYSSSCDMMNRFPLTIIHSNWLLTYWFLNSSRFRSKYFFRFVLIIFLKAILLNKIIIVDNEECIIWSIFQISVIFYSHI